MGQIGDESEEVTVVIPEPVKAPEITPIKTEPERGREPGLIPMEPIQVPIEAPVVQRRVGAAGS